jgi:hypothetical protein
MHLLDSLLLSLPFLPGIRDGGVLGGVLDPDFLIHRHILLLDVQALGAEGDLLRVGLLGDIPHLLGHHVFLRAAGAAIDEGEIAFLDTRTGDFEESFG